MFGRKALLGISTELIITILKTIPLFFIFNIFSADEFGLLGFASGFVSMFAIVTNIGIEQAHITIVNQKKYDEKTCVGTFLFLKSITYGIMYPLIVLFILFVFAQDPVLFTPLQILIIYIYLLSTILNEILNLENVFFTSQLKTANLQIPKTIINIVNILLVFLIIFQFQNFIFYASLSIITTSIEIIWKIFLLKRLKIAKPRKSTIKAYLALILVLAPATVIYAFSQSFCTILLRLSTNTAAVGFQYIVTRLIEILAIIPTIFSALTSPMQARFLDQNDFKAVEKLNFNIVRYYLIFFIPLITIGIYVTPVVINFFFGSKMLPISFFLQLSLMNFFLSTVSTPYRQELATLSGLYISSSEKTALRKNAKIAYTMIYICTALTDIFFYIVFIPSDIFGVPMFNLGLDGIGIANIIGSIVSVTALYYYIKKIRGYRFKENFLKIGIAGAIQLGIILIGFSLFPSSGGLIKLFISAVSFGVFFIILIIWKEITTNDVKFFKDLLDVRKMTGYIKNELMGKEEGDI